MIESLAKILQNWENSVVDFLPKIVLAIVLFLLFVLLAKLSKKMGSKLYSKSIRIHPEIVKILTSVVSFFFILSGVFLSLKVLGLESMLAHLLAGAGIVGIVAGFAFKDIASNIFAGLLLKIQHPYQKGDWVKIDDKYGAIVEVGWITTSIKTVPGQLVFIPNQIVYSNPFTNYSTWGKVRIILECGVSYGDDLEHVMSTAIDEVKNIKEVLVEDGVDFYFTEIGNSTYNFVLRFWIKFESNDDYCRGMNDIIVSIKKRFEKENISIAYPVTTLDFGVKGGVNIFDKGISIKSE